MTPTPFRWAMRGALAQVAHVTPVPAKAATGVVGDVYAAAEREFGLLAPPVALHSPDPGLLVVSWVLLRETLLVTRYASRAVKEAVATGVSLGNSCPYCVEVHSAVLGGLHGRADARAIAAGRVEDVVDPALRAVTAWARDGGPAPFPAEQVPELLAVALVFHYLNRMVHIFLGPSPLPPALPAAAGGAAGTMLGRVLAPTAMRRLEPGAGPGLPDHLSGALPADLAWAGTHPVLAATLARATAAVEAAGARVLDEPARDAVRAALTEHPGHLPGLDTGWLDAALSGLPPARHPAARLALLTALAPYRVDGAVVGAFRAGRPTEQADADIVALTAWASLTAARDRTRSAAAAVRNGDAAA